MKKVLFITIAIFIYTSGYNQQTEPQQQLTKQEYLQKSKKQKTTAWIMLGGGIVVSVVGISQLNYVDGTANNTPAAVLFFTGVATVIPSILFFSAAKRNRNRADVMALNLKFEKSNVLKQNRIANLNYPALSFRISL